MAHDHGHDHDGEAGERDLQLAGFAASLIRVQLALAGDMAQADRARDAFARGYVLGVADAICQRAGIDEDTRCFGLCVATLFEVFGEQEGAALGRLILDEVGSGESLRGQNMGGADLMKYVLSPEAKPPKPAGLLNHILGEND